MFSSSLLVTFTLFFLSLGCQEPPNRGHAKCRKPQKAIKFYYDKKLEMCLPFLYEGCGGNSNRYDGSDLCNLRCRPADKGICGGGSKAYGSCSNRNKTCEKGSRCVIMAFGIGLCCDEKIQEAWNQENHPKCSIPNHEVVTESVWYGEQERLGRSCSHKFCPLGSKCVEGRWLAHCCRPVIKAANS
uniref:BPTI/Kunitz inhibitor domain-containing protein n=1 Tax=Caenorhabditis japonica TaxID=281687 RepID=A0A8R1I2T4_CAEJA